MLHTRTDRGAAMVLVIVLVVVLMGLGGAFMATTYIENQGTVATQNELSSKQAAAAALDKTRLLLYEIRAAGGTWNDTLNASYSYFQMSGYQCDGSSTSTSTQESTTATPTHYPGQTNYYEYNVSNGQASTTDTRTAGVSPYQFYGQNFVHGNCIYNVMVGDDNDGDGNATEDSNDTVVVFTTVAAPANPAPGEARRILGVTRTVVFFQPPNFMPQNAIVTGGSLRIAGNPTITGTHGSVHTNGDLMINGGPTISQVSSATGSITVTGSPSLGGTQSNAPVKPLPKIDPSEHLNKAQYVFDNDGKVYDNTTSPRTLLATGSWNGFTYSAASNTWKKGGSNTPPPGSFYVNGSLEIAGSMSTAWQTALFVNGNVFVRGSPILRPYEGTVNGQPIKNVTILARGDIDIKGSGTSNADINGLIATHEQVDIAGTPKFNGSIVAEDAEDTFSAVTSVSYIDIMGNFTLTYNGGMDTFLVAGGTSVQVRSWDVYK